MSEDQKAILALTKRVAELEAENDQLREALSEIVNDIQDWAQRLDQLSGRGQTTEWTCKSRISRHRRSYGGE